MDVFSILVLPGAPHFILMGAPIDRMRSVLDLPGLVRNQRADMIDPVTIATVVATTILAPFAKGFGDWLYGLFRKKSEAKVTIRTADGRTIKISASDLKAADLHNLIEQLRDVKQPLATEDDGQNLKN
jgi:hypothetical protein